MLAYLEREMHDLVQAVLSTHLGIFSSFDCLRPHPSQHSLIEPILRGHDRRKSQGYWNSPSTNSQLHLKRQTEVSTTLEADTQHLPLLDWSSGRDKVVSPAEWQRITINIWTARVIPVVLAKWLGTRRICWSFRSVVCSSIQKLRYIPSVDVQSPPRKSIVARPPCG